ncbi:MAG: hypothetical protein KJ687_10690 [Proteobacteria bacterium]|nr:hypothetical protein [Pseudomonadota bacterium]
MQLGALGLVKFREITHTPQVQTRIEIAKESIRFNKSTFVFSCQSIPAHNIRNNVLDSDRNKLGIYFCFGGDVSTFIAATGISTFICFDQHPFFRHSGLQVSLTNALEIYKAFYEKLTTGFLHNRDIDIFREVGIFAFADILGFGGRNLRVFKGISGDNKDIIKMCFDCHEEKYRVYFLQERIVIGDIPGILKDLPIGVVLLKAGKHWVLYAYKALESFASLLPKGTLVIADQEINSLSLNPILCDEIEFGYEVARLYRVI